MQTRREILQYGSLVALGASFAAGTMAMAAVNRRIVLASRPTGKPTAANFRMESVPIPALTEGQVLLRTLYLSLDPYMRGRMNAGASYAARVEIDGVMVGSTVARVEHSRHAGFAEGDLVMAYSGWQEYEVSDGHGVSKLDPRISPPSYALGVLGMPGLTAYVGLLDIGQPKPLDLPCCCWARASHRKAPARTPTSSTYG